MPHDPESMAQAGEPSAPRHAGQLLQAERLRRGLTLEAVEAETRVRRPFLEAIEEGRWDQLPGPVYTRGFIRLYARAVGLDPQVALRAYEAETARLARPRHLREPLSQRRPPDRPGGQPWWALPDPILKSLEPGRRLRTAGLVALAVVAVAMGGSWLLSRLARTPAPAMPSLEAMRPEGWTGSTPEQTTPPAVPPAAGPAANPGSEGSAPEVALDTLLAGARPPGEAGSPVEVGGLAALQPAEPPGDSVEGEPPGRPEAGQRVQLVARVRGRSWMEVYADGQLVFSRSAEPGEVLTWQAERVVTVRFGRPEVVDLALNGVELGRAGTGVITRSFTADMVQGASSRQGPRASAPAPPRAALSGSPAAGSGTPETERP